MAKEVKAPKVEPEVVEPETVEPEVLPEDGVETAEQFKARKAAELAQIPVFDINSDKHANMTYEEMRSELL